MTHISLSEIYFDLRDIWEDLRAGELFHISEHHPAPAIAQLINEHNDANRDAPIGVEQDGVDWLIDVDDRDRLLSWYRGFIGTSPGANGEA